MMTWFTGNTKELVKKLNLEFIDGLSIVSKLSSGVVTSGSSGISEQKFRNTIQYLEEVNSNIQGLVLVLKGLLVSNSPKDTQQESTTLRSRRLRDPGSRSTNVPKHLNFILKYQSVDIKKEIKLEEEKIQHILEKIKDFPTLDVYVVWGLDDGPENIDTSAVIAYMSNKYSKGRSIELMRQLTDSNLNSNYYQILENPKSSLEEKNKNVMEAFSKFGNSESLDHREKTDKGGYVEVEKGGDFIGIGYALNMKKKKLSRYWQRLDQVARFHFRNLKPAPPKLKPESSLDKSPKEKNGTYLTDVNRTIYEITSLKKLLQAKRDYVKYLIQKSRTFLKRNVNYGHGERDCIRKRFIPIPGEDLGERGWDDYGVDFIGSICTDDSDFVKRYFDFSLV